MCVCVCLYVESVSRSKDYVRSRIKAHQTVCPGRWGELSQNNLSCCRHFFFGHCLCDFVPRNCPHGLTFTWWGCCGLCLWRKPTELARSFLFCSCVCFCLYGRFNCISFHKFSRQVSAFLLCSSGLIFMEVSLSPDIILCGWLGSKHQLAS